jgi:hypothetical protein
VALEDLQVSAAARREGEVEVRQNVSRCRVAGVTWREIAAVLEVTLEGARKRYRDDVPPPAALR